MPRVSSSMRNARPNAGRLPSASNQLPETSEKRSWSGRSPARNVSVATPRNVWYATWSSVRDCRWNSVSSARVSGTLGNVPSAAAPWRTTSCSSLATGSGRSSNASATVTTAVAVPIPIARVTTATFGKPDRKRLAIAEAWCPCIVRPRAPLHHTHQTPHRVLRPGDHAPSPARQAIDRRDPCDASVV